MIIVRIVGGLGNQMFQYAFAKSLQEKGFKVKIDTSKFKKYKLHGGYQLNKFQIDIEASSDFDNLRSKLQLKKNVKEKSLLFDEKLTRLEGNEYVKGYFQTEKYFSNIRTTLLSQFILKTPLSSSTLSYKNQIEKFENSCAIHVRRGDYVSNQKANSIHGTCDVSYYHKAMEFIESKCSATQFFIFSDDISWVKNNLEVKNCTFIDHNTIPHEDMYLMSLCKNNITANSSFSWWGAWLNKNEEKLIISPKKWFLDKENEIVCKNWIQL